MAGLESSPPRTRRWFMPIVILLAAAGLAIWGAQREAQQMAEIRQMIVDLCRDIHDGEDVSGRIDAMMPLNAPGLSATLKPRLTEALTRACASATPESPLQVVVTPGDAAEVGRFSGSATHTAILSVDDVQLLGLRIKYNGAGKPITVLGYWTPQG